MDNYFIQAQRVRRLVQQDFDDVFSVANPLHDSTEGTDGVGKGEEEGDKVDLILCPTAPTPPPLLDDVKAKEGRDPLDAYVNDVFTVPASLAGLPAISIPAVGEGRNEKIGMQIIGQFGCDQAVLGLARIIEESL